MGEGKKRKRKGKERETRKGRNQVRKREEAEDLHISYSFITVIKHNDQGNVQKEEWIWTWQQGQEAKSSYTEPQHVTERTLRMM